MKRLTIFAILLMAAPVLAGSQISDDFNGSYDIYWNWLPQGGNQAYSKSVATNQLSLTANTLGGEAQSIGAVAIDLSGGPAPYVYSDVFVSMDMNCDTSKANNDQGIIARVQTNNTFYGLNYDPYLNGIGLIYFNGTTFQDLAAGGITGSEQPVTLKLQALNVGSYVHLVGQAWSVGGTPSLLSEIQFRVGIDTPSGSGTPAILSAGGVGFYTAFNTNGPAENIDSLLDNFLARNGVAGDANLDGVVDLLDLGAVGDNWGGTGKKWSTGDLNLDGVVDLLDLGAVGDNWGGTGAGEPLGSPSPTPEPMTMGILALGGCYALLRRKLRK